MKIRVPHCTVPTYKTSLEAGASLVELIADTDIASSKTEARRLIENGAIYVNDTRETDPNRVIRSAERREWNGEWAVWISTRKRRNLIFIVEG